MIDDLVSRQAVTDTVRKIILGFFSDADGVMTDTEKTLLSVNKAVCNGVRELPSVQPERTCVNCGRTVNNGGWYADGRTRCPIEEHYALPKDGYCHLWEKRNVTDDDYPERQEK